MTVATPVRSVIAVPADGANFVRVAVLENVTTTPATGFPAPSNTFALAVNGFAIDTELLGVPVEPSNDSVNVGVPEDVVPPLVKPTEVVTAAVPTSTAEAEILAAPAPVPGSKVIVAVPLLSLKAVPKDGESAPAVLLTANVTTFPATAAPVASTSLADAVNVPPAGMAFTDAPEESSKLSVIAPLVVDPVAPVPVLPEPLPLPPIGKPGEPLPPPHALTKDNNNTNINNAQ